MFPFSLPCLFPCFRHPPADCYFRRIPYGSAGTGAGAGPHYSRLPAPRGNVSDLLDFDVHNAPVRRLHYDVHDDQCVIRPQVGFIGENLHELYIESDQDGDHAGKSRGLHIRVKHIFEIGIIEDAHAPVAAAEVQKLLPAGGCQGPESTGHFRGCGNLLKDFCKLPVLRKGGAQRWQTCPTVGIILCRLQYVRAGKGSLPTRGSCSLCTYGDCVLCHMHLLQ